MVFKFVRRWYQSERSCSLGLFRVNRKVVDKQKVPEDVQSEACTRYEHGRLWHVHNGVCTAAHTCTASPGARVWSRGHDFRTQRKYVSVGHATPSTAASLPAHSSTNRKRQLHSMTEVTKPHKAYSRHARPTRVIEKHTPVKQRQGRRQPIDCRVARGEGSTQPQSEGWPCHAEVQLLRGRSRRVRNVPCSRPRNVAGSQELGPSKVVCSSVCVCVCVCVCGAIFTRQQKTTANAV